MRQLCTMLPESIRAMPPARLIAALAVMLVMLVGPLVLHRLIEAGVVRPLATGLTMVLLMALAWWGMMLAERLTQRPTGKADQPTPWPRAR